MRLLRTDKLQLVEFLGRDIPPYAILSHTWAEKEVSLQDVQQGLAHTRRGYDKVAGACALAIQDGFDYIVRLWLSNPPSHATTPPLTPPQWIDTCCIDKTSSAELSEAINSMFKWYGDAEVCYAFLADVSASDNPRASASTFRHSRWFTRGWTLQELIAPGVVYFYDATWTLIGSRSTLLNLIVDITKINPTYFSTGNLSQFSAAQKLSWAANRTTTRPEDEAYCLLGLFDINMPLLYGEGKRAFARLQEEILRQSEDDSLFSHNHADVLAPSPWWFRNCAAVSRREAWPYKNVSPALLLDRKLGVNRARITMSFPVVRVEEEECGRLHEFCSVAWPSGRAPKVCHLALLSCGTSEATCALVLHEEKPGLFVKLAFPTRGVVRAPWKPRLAQRVETMTLSVSRAPAETTRAWDRKNGRWDWRTGAWDWRSGNEDVFFGDALRSQVRTDVDSAQGRPVMKPIVRPPAIQNGLGGQPTASQDGLRDKVIVKGPCRLTSGFELQYVYVGGFRLTWLERGDEVHLIPSEAGEQGQPCVVFSSPAKESFMVVLDPTRASANAILHTNIPPWEGEETVAYMERLERERQAAKFNSPCYPAGIQRADQDKKVVVRVESRRRRNGWLVSLSVAEV
jgi:hypothetical protein